MSGLRIFLFHLLFVSALILLPFVFSKIIEKKGSVMEKTEYETVDIMVNGFIAEIPKGMKTLTYKQVRDIAFPDSDNPKNPTCVYRYKNGISGELSPGQSLLVVDEMVVNIVDTNGA